MTTIFLFLQLGPAAALLISTFCDMQISPRGGRKIEKVHMRVCIFLSVCERNRESERERGGERKR